MKNDQVLIAVDSLMMGGIQKSLLAFLQYIKNFCDIDIVVWHDRWPEMVELPAYVNRIHVTGTESVRSAYKSYGAFSKDFLVSAFATFREKRWLGLPRIEKNYDIAIAYSHVSSLKYYIIDALKGLYPSVELIPLQQGLIAKNINALKNANIVPTILIILKIVFFITLLLLKAILLFIL